MPLLPLVPGLGVHAPIHELQWNVVMAGNERPAAAQNNPLSASLHSQQRRLVKF